MDLFFKLTANTLHYRLSLNDPKKVQDMRPGLVVLEYNLKYGTVNFSETGAN